MAHRGMAVAGGNIVQPKERQFRGVQRDKHPLDLLRIGGDVVVRNLHQIAEDTPVGAEGDSCAGGVERPDPAATVAQETQRQPFRQVRQWPERFARIGRFRGKGRQYQMNGRVARKKPPDLLPMRRKTGGAGMPTARGVGP